jgi:large subunit ribosomal protein L25
MGLKIDSGDGKSMSSAQESAVETTETAGADTIVTIEGRIRKETGKGHNRKLRASGMIPANLMSRSGATAIAINPKWLSRAWQRGKVFALDLDGKIQNVRIQELQLHPLKRVPLHVDLLPVTK